MAISTVEETPTAAFGAELRRSLPALLWPLRLRPLAVLAVASGLALTAVIPVLGPILAFALATVVLHTGFRALEHTGHQGLADSEPLILLPEGDTVVRSVVFLLALMAWGALALAIWTFGGIAGAFTGALLLAAVLPAVIIRLGREHALVNGLLDTLNPVRLIRVMHVTGRAYGVAAGIPLVLTAAILGLLYGSAGHLALPLRLVGAFFLAGYTTLVTFRLAACLAARFRDDLGYDRKRPRPAPPPAPSQPVREPSTEERIGELIKADRLEEAAEVLKGQVKAEPTSLYWWQRYYRVLRHLDQDQAILAASRGYLTALLHAGEEGQAMAVIHDALNRDRGFQTARPDQVFRLARVARRDDRPSLALRIMDGFVQRCPEHADAPKVLLFSARIMGEDFRQPREACRLLDTLIQRYPDHALAEEARRARSSLAQAS